jgi:hypothetical protein
MNAGDFSTASSTSAMARRHDFAADRSAPTAEDGRLV